MSRKTSDGAEGSSSELKRHKRESVIHLHFVQTFRKLWVLPLLFCHGIGSDKRKIWVSHLLDLNVNVLRLNVRDNSKDLDKE